LDLDDLAVEWRMAVSLSGMIDPLDVWLARAGFDRQATPGADAVGGFL
jgi:hypothetical protein